MPITPIFKRHTFSTLLLASVSMSAVVALPAHAQDATESSTNSTQTETDDTIKLDPIRVEDNATSQAGDPTPPVYA
ncbi:MAG TPA: hypothetical protein DD465_06660, partial [Thalassospira sp.]|nr:hypothetical protein [Thalassospira sp.]